MHERPQAALFQALRELGYRVDSEANNDKLPVRIYGEGAERGSMSRSTSETQKGVADIADVPAGEAAAGHGPALRPQRACRVSIAESSQFASALLLSADVGEWRVEVVGENADESPYVTMTSKLMDAFPKKGGIFQIEPDASSGSYFWAAQEIADSPYYMEYSEQWGVEVQTKKLYNITVANWPRLEWQIDEKFLEFVASGGAMRDYFAHKRIGTPLDEKTIKKIVESTET